MGQAAEIFQHPFLQEFFFNNNGERQSASPNSTIELIALRQTQRLNSLRMQIAPLFILRF